MNGCGEAPEIFACQGETEHRSVRTPEWPSAGVAERASDSGRVPGKLSAGEAEHDAAVTRERRRNQIPESKIAGVVKRWSNQALDQLEKPKPERQSSE